MKLMLRVALCCSLAACVGVAQRRGGGGGGFSGGHGGGGMMRGGSGGGVYRGGVGGGVYRGGVGGGVYRGGVGGGVYRGGVGGVYRGNVGWGYRGYGGYGGRYYGGRYYGGRYYGGYYSPYWYGGYGLGYGLGYGVGYGYWPGYGDYDSGYYDSYPAYTSYPASGYSGYDSSPNVTVVYPQSPATNTVYVERPNPVVREYDQYGQQTNASPSTGFPPSTGNSGSPVYLIAFRDHTIRAAMAYWVQGGTLHYVTLDHEQKLAPVSTVDRELSGQLNRERRVAFSLPPSQ